MDFVKHICLVSEYKDVIEKNREHFEKLESICLETGEKVEGNCFYEHLNIKSRISELIFKQCNHYTLGSMSKSIMEIGFNAGHSSLLYLISNPSCNVTIFDICEHKYTLPCFEYLQSVFPGRLEIYPGDSTITVPEYHNKHPDKRFDLIHIDGCHLANIADIDFHNAMKMASDILIWDDTQDHALNTLFNNYIHDGLVYEVKLYKTYIYEHRLCRINPLLNKKYAWEQSTIMFKSNGIMDAFGFGNYNFVDKHVVICNFGGKEHILKFNDKFSAFSAIRSDDFLVINGNQC